MERLSVADVPAVHHRLFHLPYQRHRRDQPRAVRSARGRDRAGRRVPYRVQLAQIRAIFHGRVRQYDDSFGAGDDAVLGRMEWAGRRNLPLAGPRLVPGESLLLPVPLHLAAGDAAAFPLRPVDEFRVEGVVAGGALQHRPGFGHRSLVLVSLLWNFPTFSFWVSPRWP